MCDGNLDKDFRTFGMTIRFVLDDLVPKPKIRVNYDEAV